MDRSSPIQSKRRPVLKTLGALSTVGLSGLAGCGGDGGGDGGNGGDGDTISSSEYPAVDEWLTETEVGGADDSYNGEIIDRRDTDNPTIDVGAEGNEGAYAFDPSAVAVSAGTTVRWDWTGEGGLHNVVADPDGQLGESDYEFSSGDPVSGDDNEFSHTFEQSGIALYQCEPHLTLGMKGAIVVD